MAYTGAVAPEAIDAIGLMAEDRRDVGLAGYHFCRPTQCGLDRRATRSRAWLGTCALAYRDDCSRTCRRIAAIVTVLDGHPATLAWLGAVGGHRTRPLGVEHFGQTGSLADLYRHYGIDANAIVAAAQAIAPGRPIRHLKALP